MPVSSIHADFCLTAPLKERIPAIHARRIRLATIDGQTAAVKGEGGAGPRACHARRVVHHLSTG
jgi:hypothetical protein